jgi:hypothetical protein
LVGTHLPEPRLEERRAPVNRGTQLRPSGNVGEIAIAIHEARADDLICGYEFG